MICLFMVMQKSMMKYMTRMGQNTGTLNASKKVQTMATRMPLVAECLGGGGEGREHLTWALAGHSSVSSRLPRLTAVQVLTRSPRDHQGSAMQPGPRPH